MTTKRYSRLASVEEQKNIKKAYLYITLSILAVVFLIFLGIPILVKFAGFVGDIAKSDKPVDAQDITPPAPPQFDDLPEFTNNETLKITGKSEAGATVIINANNESSEVIANNEGVFNFIFNLNSGTNTLDAYSKDTSGNKSTKTLTKTIVFDNTEPELEIDSPSDGSGFFGANQKQLNIKGSVNELVDITINGRIVSLKEDLTFNYSTTMSEGENKFEIVAKDQSLNETSKTLSVNFSL